MKKLITSSVVFLSVLGLSSQVDASESQSNDNLNIKVNVTQEQVELDWNDVADNYKILLKDEEVWEGSISEFKAESLKSNSPYNYTIQALDGNSIVETAEIRTKTLPDQTHSRTTMSTAATQPEEDSSFIDAVIQEEEVKLNLRGHIPDNNDKKIEIYKDEKLIEDDSNGEYVDADIEAGKTYTYKYVSERRVSKEKENEINSELKERKISDLTDEEKEFLYYEPYEYIKVVNIPQNEAPTENSKDTFSTKAAWEPPAGPAPNQIGFRYRTFIPMKYAPAASIKEGLTKGYQFGGDNRGFSFSGGTHRTAADVVVRFNSNSSSSYFRKESGVSKLYDKNNKLLDSTTPSSSGIKLQKGTADKNENFVRLTHAAQVGYSDAWDWITPDINYVLGILTYSDGGFSLSGSRDQAPSHELYAYVPYSSQMITIFRADHKGFEYLLPIAPSATIRASM